MHCNLYNYIDVVQQCRLALNYKSTSYCLSNRKRCVMSNSAEITYMLTGVEFRQKIYLSDGQVDLQNHLSVMKSTCPTQENHKIKRLFNVAP